MSNDFDWRRALGVPPKSGTTGPLRNPNPSTWTPSSTNVPRPGGYPNPDPYNWKQIAADLAAEEARKRQAQARIRNPTAPRAVAQAAPKALMEDDPSIPAFSPNGGQIADFANGVMTYTDGYTFASDGWRNEKGEKFEPGTPSIKQLLDAYRAMNNGALPPGTSPEMAAMIDKGIWSDWSTIDGNPQLAQALLSIQGAITGLPAQYQAAKQGIMGNYSGITGAIVNPASAWGSSMTGAMTSDPFNPNAALAGSDPALVNYNNTISAISGTAGLNQATDLSWFDKMLQNQTSNYDMMLRTAALQGIPVPEEEDGGGGGGGGGGRGRGGGGGSGGGKPWTDPKTEITDTDLVQTNEADVQKGYNLGFWADLEDSARSPEELAYFDQIFNQYKSNPQNVAAGLETEMTTAEAKIAEMQAQAAARLGYEKTIPASIATNSDTRRTNLGNYVFADSPDDHVDRKKWMIDEDVEPNVQTEEQARFNTHAEEMDNLLAARLFLSRIGNETPNLAKWLNRKNTSGVANQVETLPKKWEQELIAKQQAWDEQGYHDFRTNWDANNEAGAVWNWNNWPGWVEKVDPKSQQQVEERLNFAQQMAAIAAEHNPNKSLQNVSTTRTDSATQKSQGVTKQHTYDPLDSIGPNLQDQPTGYNDANFMPEFQTPAEDMIEGGLGIDPQTGLPYSNSDFDPADVFGESRGLSGSSLTGARLAAIAKESLRQKREGSRRPKAAIEAEENRPKLKEAAPKKAPARRTKAAIEAADLKTPRVTLRPGGPVAINPRTISVMGKSISSVKPKAAKKPASKSRPKFARWR